MCCPCPIAYGRDRRDTPECIKPVSLARLSALAPHALGANADTPEAAGAVLGGGLRLYVVPHSGHRSAPRVIAALAGFVHDRQSAADYECNHNNNN
jgi:hypothetical protein